MLTKILNLDIILIREISKEQSVYNDSNAFIYANFPSDIYDNAHLSNNILKLMFERKIKAATST